MARINNILAEQTNHVSFCFGRMNPPHFGHEGVIKTVQSSAKEGNWAIFVSKTHEPRKNPLTYDQKVRWIYALYPQTKGHLVEDPNIKTVLQAAAYLYTQGYRSATFVAGEDDMPQMRKLLEDYNGAEGKSHGFYKFEPMSFVESPRLTSATNARQAAQDNDPEAFELATRVRPDIMVDGKTLFQTVRAGMGLALSESMIGKQRPDMVQIFNDFLPVAMKVLKLDKLPAIKLSPTVTNSKSPTFGRYVNGEHTIYLGMDQRHPLDIIRTLAHELVHFKQHLMGKLDSKSGDTGSPEENQAHALAGIIMRRFNGKHPQYFQDAALSLEENFKDGKGPGRPGDAKRHGVPTKASVSTLRKIAKQGGRKGQLAHWMANMKSGKKKASESGVTVGALDKATPTIAELMAKYNVSLERIKRELRRGIKVELEHTSDVDVASEIARDHLNEKLDYYTELAKVEKTEANIKPGNSVLGNRAVAINPFDYYTPFMNEQTLDEASLTKIRSFADDPFLDQVNLAWELELIWPDHDDGRHEDEDYDQDSEPDYDADESIDTRDFDSFSTDVMNFFRGDYNSRGDVRDALDAIKESYSEWLTEQWNDLDDEEKEEEYGGNETKYIDDKWDDNFSEWCDNENLSSMSDLPNFSGVYLTWPHYTEPERDYREKGELTRQDLRSMFIRQFGEMLQQDGFKVIAWDHPSKDKEPNTWYFEPDGSLNAADDNDGGVELTSPIIPYKRSLEYLDKIFAWAKSNGAYTGSDFETGMHLNLSLPEQDMDNVDWVKLILMGGDDRVLRDFDRWANGDFGWAHSALKKMKQLAAAQQPMTPDAVISIISNELTPEARRDASNLISGNKYMSVHPKGKSPGGNFGYVEFRSAGGDTLDNLDKVKTAALQYARSLYIASNPDVEKKEYASKLIRLFADNKYTDPGMDAFRDYAAGKIDIKNLKYRLIQRAKARGQEPKATVSGHEYSLTNKETKDKIFVVADSLTDAVPQMLRQALDKNSNLYRLGGWKVDLQGDEKVYRFHVCSPGGDSAEFRLVVIANSDKEAIDAAKKRLGDDLEYNARDVYLPDLGDLWNLLQNGRQDRDPAEKAAAKTAAAPPKTMGPIINLKTGEPRPAFTEPQAQPAVAPTSRPNAGPGTYIITYLPPQGNEQKTAYDANDYHAAIEMFAAQHPASYRITSVMKQEETPANESLFHSIWQHADHLDEVKMAPGTLAKFAKTDVAKEIRVGWEAEMFVPDLEEDDPEAQLDMSVDEPIPFGERGWMENIYRFWQNADGNTHSRREIENAIDDMMEIWYDHISYEFDRYLGTKEGYDEIEETIKEQNPDIEDAEVSYAIIDRDEKWDNAIDTMRERFDEQMNYDAEEFRDAMRSQNIRNYSDFSRRFGLDWPYYDYNAGGMSYETLVSDFVDSTGYPAKFGRYSEKPDDTTGVFKEDGSLRRGDLPSNYSGIEFASAYRPLEDSVEMLNKFWKWAGNLGGETNESCGFHMGISIPDHTADSVDVLKFVLFLGDNKVLEDFGRQSNRWAKSTIDQMRTKAQNNGYHAEQSLQAFRDGLDSLAAKAAKRVILHIPGEQGGDRYLSVNYKSNYIEVRSAGGDYFNMKDKILETMNRYVRVLALASNPKAEVNEYYKKLYDVLSRGEKQVSYYDPKDPANQKNVTKTTITPQPGYRQVVDTKMDANEKDAIKLFSRYVTQGLPKAALKSFLRNLQGQRSVAKNIAQQGGIPAELANDRSEHTFIITNTDADNSYVTQRRGTYSEVIRWLESETRGGFEYNLWLVYDYEDHRLVGRVTNGVFTAAQAQQAQQPAAGNQTVYHVLRMADNFKVHEFLAPNADQAQETYERWVRNQPFGGNSRDYRLVAAGQPEQEPRSVFQNLNQRDDDDLVDIDTLNWEPEPEPVNPNAERSYRVTFMYNGELGSATIRGTSRQDAIARFQRENPNASLRSMEDPPAQRESKGRLFNSSIARALLSEEELDEVAMNPSAFQAFLSTEAAQKMTMGFEAEMCVKNLDTGRSAVRPTPRLPEEDEMKAVFPFDDAGKAHYYEFWGQNNANARRSITYGLKRLSNRMKTWMDGHARGEEITSDHWERFLRGGGYRNWTNMYQLNEVLDLVWPYGNEEGSRFDREKLRQDFQASTGFQAVIFNSYHAGSKPKDKFVFEPDGSLRPKSGDGAQELVSYAMPLPQAIDALNKMFAWANEKGYVYTNTSTGFHVNVGMGENTPDKIDQLKLLLLLGDQQLLKDFNRDANSYCASMMNRLNGVLRRADQRNINELLNTMKTNTWDGLRKLASRYVERAQSGDKFVSVNNKGKYIEFRGPGGDWMNNQDKLRNTILQVTRAYAMAADPKEGQQDYLKKAYKLLSSMGEQKDDRLKVFVDWTMGRINQSELLNQLQRRQGRPATQRQQAAPVGSSNNMVTGVSDAEIRGVLDQLPDDMTAEQTWRLYDANANMIWQQDMSADYAVRNAARAAARTSYSEGSYHYLQRADVPDSDPFAEFKDGQITWGDDVANIIRGTQQPAAAQQPVDTTDIASVIRALPPEYTQVQAFTLYDDSDDSDGDVERTWNEHDLNSVMAGGINISVANPDITFTLYRDNSPGVIATFSDGNYVWGPDILSYVNRQSTRQQSSAGNNDRHYYGLTTLDGRIISSYEDAITQDQAIRWATSRQGSGDLPVLLIQSDSNDLDNSITVGSIRSGNFMPAPGQQPAATGFTRPSQDLEIENLIAQLPRNMTIAQSWTIRNIEGEEVEDFTDTAADAVAYLRDYSSDSPGEEFYLQADNTHTDEDPYNFASAGAGRVDLFGAQEYAREQGHTIAAPQPAQQQPAAQSGMNVINDVDYDYLNPRRESRSGWTFYHADRYGNISYTPILRPHGYDALREFLERFPNSMPVLMVPGVQSPTPPDSDQLRTAIDVAARANGVTVPAAAAPTAQATQQPATRNILMVAHSDGHGDFMYTPVNAATPAQARSIFQRDYPGLDIYDIETYDPEIHGDIDDDHISGNEDVDRRFQVQYRGRNGQLYVYVIDADDEADARQQFAANRPTARIVRVTELPQQQNESKLIDVLIAEERKHKPKKPKTIIDGAMKTLIAKGRSEDEAIADLKKEIDKKFYTESEEIAETLKRVKGKWALVSKSNPDKVLQYYHGDGHPSKEWVSKVERRVHSFSEEKDQDNR